jgi:hypothetical protein
MNALFALALLAATPPRIARMEVTHASGAYEAARGATLALAVTDDGDPRTITISVAGRQIAAPVWASAPGRCGDRIQARAESDGAVSDVTLTDYTHARCRIYAPRRWHAYVETREADGTRSLLRLEGNPD